MKTAPSLPRPARALAPRPASAPPAGVSANRVIIAATVTLAALLERLDVSVVNVALPDMMANLGASLDEIAWVVTGYVVANAIIIPVSAWLADRLGRTRYFALSIGLFTVASFFCGNAASLGALVAWRVLQGLGGGAFLATAQATLYEVFPPEEFGKAQAIFGMGIVAGPALGPALGGYITDAASWHWIFFINVPLGIAALLLTLAFVPDSPFARRERRIDQWGLLFLIVGIGCFQLMLDRGERQDWFDSTEIVAYAVVSALSLAALVWRELTTDHPIVDLTILRNRQFAAGALLGFFMGGMILAPVFVLPLYLQGALGYSALQAGLVILPGALAAAVMNGTMARLARKTDGRILIAIGIALFALSMTHQWARFTLQSGRVDFLLPLILRGIAIGFIFVPLSNLVLADLPKRALGNGSALYNLTRQIGGSVGIAVAATLIARFRDIGKAVLLSHISLYDEATRQRLAALGRGLVAKGVPAPSVREAAMRLLDGAVTGQATMIAIERVFALFGMAFVAALPLLLFMRQGRTRGRGGRAPAR